MKKLVLAISALAVVTSAAFADPITERRALMKANGAALGVIVPMVKGEKPFDAAEVLAALAKVNEDAQKMDVATLWPEGSDTGDTKSSPAIWQDLDGFKAAIAKFQVDAAAAVAAAPQDLDALKEQLGALGANCGACHKAYRL